MDIIIVLLAAIISFAIGGLWFSPKTFYPIYEKESKVNKINDMSKFNPIKSFALVFVAELLIAILIYMMTKSMKRFNNGWCNNYFSNICCIKQCENKHL